MESESESLFFLAFISYLLLECTFVVSLFGIVLL